MSKENEPQKVSIKEAQKQNVKRLIKQTEDKRGTKGKR